MIIVLLAVLVVVGLYIVFTAKAPREGSVAWGVNFSQMQAEALGLDWKKVYLSLLEDLKVKKVKLLVQWDFIEEQEGKYFFDDVDWQLAQAKSHGVQVIFVTGMKSGRWPECHIPTWAEGLSKDQQQEKILTYVKTMVGRYKGSAAVVAWQAENEPLFHFGKCPWYDKDFLKKEVALIKSLDALRPVIVSDSGEQSPWLQVARIGDKVGVTMYRKVWVHLAGNLGFYVEFPLPPITYWMKAWLVDKLFNKEVICIELQAEPWTSEIFYEVSLKEQEKTMNLAQFKKNIQYAEKTGFKEIYLWGAEWWYWLKEKQQKPEIWEEARTLFLEG